MQDTSRIGHLFANVKISDHFTHLNGFQRTIEPTPKWG